MATLAGVGTAVVAWPVLFLAVLAGLVAAMPARYGGLDLGFGGGLVASWGLGITLMAGLVWLASRLLRRAGVRHPLMVVLAGLGLAVVLTTASSLLLHAAALQPPDWAGMLVLPAAGLCFGLVARVVQRRTRRRGSVVGDERPAEPTQHASTPR